MRRLFIKPEASLDSIHIIRKWVTDLRSGQYKQGVGSLCDENANYCCLGVLCEQVTPKSLVSKMLNGIKIYNGSPYFPSPDVMALIGIAPDSTMFDVEDKPYYPKKPLTHNNVSLVECNDILKLPFTQIADIIEDQFFLATGVQL